MDYPIGGLADAVSNDDFVADMNAYEIGAAVTAAGIAVASLGITTTLAPSVVLVPGAVAGGLAVAGYNKRNGHLPFMGDRTTPAAVAAPQPAAVVNHAGAPVEVSGL